MADPRGLPRLVALFQRWVRRVSVEIDSGCIYISGAVEFDDRPGPVRDALAGMVQAWHDALGRAIGMAVAEGHLRDDTEPAQLLFEVHGLILALHHDARFLRDSDAVGRARKGFDRIIASHVTDAGKCALETRRAARRRGPAACPLTARREAHAQAESRSPHSNPSHQEQSMAVYNPPLRDMQFVMHEVLQLGDALKELPRHAEIDADTVNAVIEEGGKFAANVLFPLNQSGDAEGCTLDKESHAVSAPKGFDRPTKNMSKAAGRR